MTDAPPRLTWDLFCHVVDNWGDLGVCWRLAANLAARGQTVRLWVDDPAPLQWMAPGALEGRHPGVTVRPWPRLDPSPPPTGLPAADVLVQAFGCDIDPAWVQRLLPEGGGPQRVWLNLEYLSAEAYVERCHRLPSPVLHGPLSGRTQWFFYPGFTPGTGGLLREPDLMARITAHSTTRQTAHATNRPSRPRPEPGPPGPSGPCITLFSYETPALGPLLAHPDLAHAHWRVTPGRSAQAFAQARAQLPPTASAEALPYLPQHDFDPLLWDGDLNFVRGEDSLVRALWAGAPLVWQIYPQHDNAHHAKLDAFLDWLQAPADLRRLHHAWNGMATPDDLPRLDRDALTRWGHTVQAARQRLLAQADLTGQLLAFVMEKR